MDKVLLKSFPVYWKNAYHGNIVCTSRHSMKDIIKMCQYYCDISETQNHLFINGIYCSFTDTRIPINVFSNAFQLKLCSYESMLFEHMRSIELQDLID